jgi:hypothetical protein
MRLLYARTEKNLHASCHASMGEKYQEHIPDSQLDPEAARELLTKLRSMVAKRGQTPPLRLGGPGQSRFCRPPRA